MGNDRHARDHEGYYVEASFCEPGRSFRMITSTNPGSQGSRTVPVRRGLWTIGRGTGVGPSGAPPGGSPRLNPLDPRKRPSTQQPTGPNAQGRPHLVVCRGLAGARPPGEAAAQPVYGRWLPFIHTTVGAVQPAQALRSKSLRKCGGLQILARNGKHLRCRGAPPTVRIDRG